MGKKNKFIIRFSVICLFITIVVSVFSFVFYYNSRTILRDSIDARLISNLQTASDRISVSEHKRIRETYAHLGQAGDNTAGLDDDGFNSINSTLSELATALDSRFFYTINILEDKGDETSFYFVYDSDLIEPTYVGETYTKLSKESIKFFRKGFDTIGKVSIMYNLKDYSGRYVTGCIPLLDDDGNVETLLCVDISNQSLFNHKRTFVITVISLESTLIVTFAIIALYIARLLRFNDDMQKKIAHMAYYDSLTTLPNRASILEKMNEFLHIVDRDESLSLAVLFIDVDNFKAVNDSEGHVAGDILLQEIAFFLQSRANFVSAINSEKEYVARLGGDEFVILYPISGAIQDKLENFAQSIINEFKELKSKNEVMQKYGVSLSIGAAVYPNDAPTISLLLKAADTAMYSVKRSGKSAYAIYNKK